MEVGGGGREIVQSRENVELLLEELDRIRLLEYQG